MVTWRSSCVESLMRGILYRLEINWMQESSSSFIAFEALPCRMVGRMLQPHDNYNCAKYHSKWMEGRRNRRSSSGWSQRVGVTLSVPRDWSINWVRRRWKQWNFQCYRSWHSSFKVEVFGGCPTWLRFWKWFQMGKWRWNWFWTERIWCVWQWTGFVYLL